jgi:pimeloyl-ACP methyl ester carboxylesterase
MKKLELLLTVFIFFSFNISAQQLVSSEYATALNLMQMQNNFGSLAQNAIEAYKLTYTTTDIHGQLDTASGLITIPLSEEEEFSYPMLCYLHGTTRNKEKVPSELYGDWNVAALFSGMRYVAVAPDYLGLGESRGFHPYAHAETEDSASIDMMRAARQFMEAYESADVNDQIFITGYSQGGHAAAALHRELEQNLSQEFSVVASAPLSGPYDISGEMVDLLLKDEPYDRPSLFIYVTLAYNEIYGLYSDLEDYFRAPYLSAIQEFYEGDLPILDLDDVVVNELIQNEGAALPRFIFQDSIINVLQSKPEDHPLIQALQDNDVYDWSPQAPTRLFYCEADEVVVYTNSTLADSVMNENGAVDIMAIDVGPQLGHNECGNPAILSAVDFFEPYKQVLVSSNDQESSRIKPVRIAPNPAIDLVHLSGVPPSSQVSLFNANGQFINKWEVHDSLTTLSVQHLAPGLYFLHIKGKEGAQSYKIIIR